MIVSGHQGLGQTRTLTRRTDKKMYLFKPPDSFIQNTLQVMFYSIVM